MSSRFSGRKNIRGLEIGSFDLTSLCFDRCFFRATSVALLFLSERVVNIRVNWWLSGRESRNSSISRRHVARPSPLECNHVNTEQTPIRKSQYLFAPVTRI